MSDILPVSSSARSSTASSLTDKQWPDDAWWQTLNDPTLNEIVLRVRRGNLTVAQARERLVAASALARSAASAYRPGLSLSGAATASTSKVEAQDISRRPAQINLETGWEISLFGQDGMTRQSADMDAAMAAADLDAASLSVIAEAAKSYVRLRALQQERRDAELRISVQAKASKIANTLSQSGLGTKLAAQLSTDDVLAATEQKRLLDNAIADEIQSIAILQGSREGDVALSAIGPQPSLGRDLAMEVPADLLRRRADVRRAEFAVLKAAAEVGIAKADLYPKLHLSGMIGFGSPVSGSLFGLMGGPSLQLPIFDQGKRRDIVEARAAQLREATSAYRQAVLVAYGEASTALRALHAARQSTARARSDFATASKAQAAAELMSREGLADAAKVLDRQLITVERRKQITEAVAREAEAFIAFVKATGGGSGKSKGPRLSPPEQKRGI
ncbi:TolC family protein [Rhizobium helianthi]|uniref:TolC family protein n=1 Tax=Rhizobium helianthi TaxID=1132695 RepID=A0ABW4M7A2_9HYPH